MYVRLTCGVAASKASPDLPEKIRRVGVEPIITSLVVRAVYEGEDVALATRVKAIFEQEDTTDIYFDDGRRPDDETRSERKNRKRHRKGRRA